MELNLHEWGDPSAPPVVCLHGVSAHGRRFRRLAEESLVDRFRGGLRATTHIIRRYMPRETKGQNRNSALDARIVSYSSHFELDSYE